MLAVLDRFENKQCLGEGIVFRRWTVSGMVAPFRYDLSWDFAVDRLALNIAGPGLPK